MLLLRKTTKFVVPRWIIYNSLNQTLISQSFLSGSNGNYIDEMYKIWKKSPSSVHKSWDVYFSNVEKGNVNSFQLPPYLKEKDCSLMHFQNELIDSQVPKQFHDKLLLLNSLIQSYQTYGHFLSKLNPLDIQNSTISRDYRDKCDYKNFGFLDTDLKKVYRGIDFSEELEVERQYTLEDIIKRLEDIYCNTIGWEFMHISDTSKRNWLKTEILSSRKTILRKEEKLLIMKRLNEADSFEKFLKSKWTNEKRFGLEGLESLNVVIKGIIDKGADLGLNTVVLGMSHRGRLNVLANVVKKPLRNIFSQFNPHLLPSEEGSGDVKYHLGASCDRLTRNGKIIHLSLIPNPSHLESGNPIVLGKVHGEQFYSNDTEHKCSLPLLLHGDAAFSGQGIVYECLNLSNLIGYSTGGTIHIVCNNQIGFTTNPSHSRSSHYSTDIAKCIDAPVFHVNSDDPEAVLKVSEMAIKWRQRWGTDVVIDLVGYRRYGHNEGDNPSITQPTLYQKIEKHPSVESKYKKTLIEQNILTETEYQKMDLEYQNMCKIEFDLSKDTKFHISDKLKSRWSEMDFNKPNKEDFNTGVDVKILRQIGKIISTTPKSFQVNQTVERMLNSRSKSIENESGIDWATSEALAIGSLLLENIHVRLSGQDVERGTFSQRHHVLHNQSNEDIYVPLSNLSSHQAKYSIINSSLSEFGVLGFELGYSYVNPNALICWEAQFGDFFNGAQIIIDQFLSSGEQKWLRQSGLTLLLPHGYEGMGPEHSSARLERFLQSCDDDPDVFPQEESIEELNQKINWQIVNCSTPANYFHVLRRQIHRTFRKPLIVMTPKSLLRLKTCTSSFDEMRNGTKFRKVIGDLKNSNSKLVKKILFCSGKIKFGLLKAREDAKITESELAIVSIEELAPFPYKCIVSELESYPSAKVYWVQEEHKNMGAWNYVFPRFSTAMKHSKTHSDSFITYIGRSPSAATACGLKSQHEKEEQQLLNRALFIE